MGFRRSEYGRQFKEPSWEAHQEPYRENVSYRTYRRQLEHHHNFVEWDWDTESEGSRAEIIGSKAHRRRRIPAEKTRASNGGMEEGSPNEGRAIAERGLTDREVQTPDWEVAENGGRRSDRAPGRRKTKYQPEIAVQQTSRPVTAPGRGHRAEPVKPPLIAFGWADAKRDMGGKKTFNVRASAHGDSSQVFPAALRAMRRSEYAIKYREEQQRREQLKTRRLRAAFNVPPPEDGSMWMTEYQRNFSGQPGSR